MENYNDMAIEDVYEILCEGEYHWPKHFAITEKHGILDQLMEYFASKEEFEKCIRLQTIKQSIT